MLIIGEGVYKLAQNTPPPQKKKLGVKNGNITPPLQLGMEECLFCIIVYTYG